MNQRYSLASMTSLDTSGPINSPPWSDTRQFPLHSENSINGCYKRHPFNYSTLILCRNPMAPIASDAENPTTEPQAEASHLELIDSSYEVIASPTDSGHTQKAILPCYSIKLHTRNACFYPRDNLLQSIGEALLPNVAPPNGPHHDLKTFALCGLGGVGKTELALEFVFAHQSHYDAMFFVHANQSTRLSEEFS